MYRHVSDLERCLCRVSLGDDCTANGLFRHQQLTSVKVPYCDRVLLIVVQTHARQRLQCLQKYSVHVHRTNMCAPDLIPEQKKISFHIGERRWL